MTKVAVFREQEEKREKKLIEFMHYTSFDSWYASKEFAPSSFDEVMLLGKDGEYDIIMAWDEGDEDRRCIFLGHWNDGVVE